MAKPKKEVVVKENPLAKLSHAEFHKHFASTAHRRDDYLHIVMAAEKDAENEAEGESEGDATTE